MLKSYLATVAGGKNLSREQAREAMHVIMSGQSTDSQIGAFLTALRMKGEISAEVAGFAETMRNQATPVRCRQEELIDTCGTGGDGRNTFNISTTVALVVAGAGLAVAKHGNRGVSSSSGSADVLEALGVNLELTPEAVADAIGDIGVGFLYAPQFHSAMKYAAKPRRELGFRTVFNLLGPLSNPASACYQLVGVYEESLTEKVAEALLELGVKGAMVVHSLDGLDEISTAAPTAVSEVRDGKVHSYRLDPAALGFVSPGTDGYKGGTPADNAAITRDILQGVTGPKRDIVLINAAAALLVGEKAANLEEGIELARRSLDSGAALAKLEALKEFSQLRREGLSLS
ncbi:MAG TPA: anthranilate phosphoribosyltransferase [Patescibacteria group bacterium]|nr:anthranilate phosphoribosyltransferase [Patescibacteria group bacterium]